MKNKTKVNDFSCLSVEEVNTLVNELCRGLAYVDALLYRLKGVWIKQEGCWIDREIELLDEAKHKLGEMICNIEMDKAKGIREKEADNE